MALWYIISVSSIIGSGISSSLLVTQGAKYFRGGMHNFVQAKQEINAIFGHLTKYLEVRSEFSADYRIADEDERDIDKFSSEVRVLIIAQRDTIIIRIGIKKFCETGVYHTTF